MQEININGIYGRLYVPSEIKGSYPTIILSHGFGGNFMDVEKYAKRWVKYGYVCFVFDFRGGGYASRSEGSMVDMSPLTEVSDLEEVMSYVTSLSMVDASQLFLMGSSQGGFVSAITASKHVDEIAGLILFYPAFVLVDDSMEMFNRKEDIPSTYSIMGMRVGKIYALDVFNYDVYAQIKHYDGPVLIIHGDRDGIVPLSYSQRAVDTYKNAQLKVLKNAGHGFVSHQQDQATEYVVDFLSHLVK